MAINKQALIRYKVLDNCFRNTGRKFDVNDLKDECNHILCDINPDSKGVSLRQIYEDISFMESSEGWNIELYKEREGRKIYYRYSDPSFSINNIPLNAVEISHLESALAVIATFKGLPQFEWVHNLIPKLRHGVSLNQSVRGLISFDDNPYLTGIELLGDIFNAVYNKRVLHVAYKPFTAAEAYEVIIHPYYLKQYNNRWFLFGYNQENEKSDWNLAIDRMISIQEMDCKYRTNTIDWNEYFEDIVGVTKPAGKDVEQILLHFFGETGLYVESKPIHGSQKSHWLENKILEVRLKLIINYEFESLVLSYA